MIYEYGFTFCRATPCTEASVEFRKETAASAAVAPCWEIKDIHRVGLKPWDAMLKCEGLKTRRHDKNTYEAIQEPHT